MRDYELVLIISPDVADENVPAAIEKVTQFVTSKGGVIGESERWGRRKFAYPINHFREGNYVLTRLKLDPKSAAELEASLKLTTEVIRHLLVRISNN